MVQRLRLISGLILFAYVLTHFVNHSLGIVSIAAMEAMLSVVYRIWSYPPITFLLYAALVTHMTLALYALWQRRSLKLTPHETVQYVLGFSVPLLLAEHVTSTRIAAAFYGGDFGHYKYLLSAFWYGRPEKGVLQMALLLAAWIHKFTGDGVMALFGLEADAPVACRQALAAARAMSIQLVALNGALAPDLHTPLATGIGLHFGPAIVGDMGDGRWRSLTAVGDTVNTASRLEALCKVHDCELVVSDDLLASAGVELQNARPQEVEIRGRSSPLVIRTIGSARELPLGSDETHGAKIGAA
jgi:class 3 adenylate cyclase